MNWRYRTLPCVTTRGLKAISRRLYTRSVTIDAPIEEVFDYIKDPAKAWVSMGTKIHNVKPTPDGVGTTFEWEDRMFGFHVSGTNEISEFVPNERLVISSSKGFTFVFDIEPAGDATKLTIGLDDAPSNWAEGVFDAVATKLTEHDMDVWLGDVKAEVETGVPRHREVERHLAVTRAVTIKAPVEAVYASLTDPHTTVGSCSGTSVSDLTKTPDVVGTTFRWHARILGIPASVGMECIAAVPSECVSFKSTSGFVQTWSVAPVEGGTKLTLSLENELSGPLGAILRFTMLRLEDRADDEWLEKIATRLEEGAAF